MELQKNIILIVEDEASLRRALFDKFTREGFSVFEAKDGEIGLTLALQEQPDVILLDMMMPKVDGVAMLHQLRSENDWGKNVPVFLLTNVSSADKRILKEVQEDHATLFLIKSDWPITKLVARVREVIAGAV